MPVVSRRGVAEGGAEGGVGIGVVGVGVIHRDLGGVLGVEAGVEAARVVVADFGLVVMARQAGQAVVAEGVVVAVVEVAEGVGLAQAQGACRATLPQRAGQADFYTLVHGGTGVGFSEDVGLDLDGEEFVAHL